MIPNLLALDKHKKECKEQISLTEEDKEEGGFNKGFESHWNRMRLG